MEAKGTLGALLPLAVVLVALLVTAESPLAALPLDLAAVGSEDVAFQDLSALVPDGVRTLHAAVSVPTGALLAATGASGRPFLVPYDAATGIPALPGHELPSPYHAVRSLVPTDECIVVAGSSVGTAPVLGCVATDGTAFADHTALLPSAAQSVEVSVGSPSEALLILRSDQGLLVGILDPGSPELRLSPVPEVENLTAVGHGVWNGSAFFLAGAWKDGRPALVELAPDGNLTDRSDALPEGIHRLDRVAWGQGRLYLAGAEDWPFGDRAWLAALDPASGTVTDLTTTELRTYDRISEMGWNGSALILLPRGEAGHVVGFYAPVEDELTLLPDVVPADWSYLALLPGEETLLMGDGDGPALGHLVTASWTWQDRSSVFAGPYAALWDGVARGTDFVVVGQRDAATAMGLLRTGDPGFEDRGRDLAIRDGAFLAAAPLGSDVLLAGANATTGLLHVYDPETGSVSNLTGRLPAGVLALTDAASNGTVAAVVGIHESGACLLLVRPDNVEDRSDAARLLFRHIARVVPHEGRFLLLGTNAHGPLAVVLDPSAGTLTTVAEDLTDRHREDALLLDGAWDGERVVVVGGSGDRPLLGQWTPSTGGYEDRPTRLPDRVQGLHRVAWTGDAFLLAGHDDRGPLLATYHPENGSVVLLPSLLPAPYATVTALVPGPSGVLVLAQEEDGDPRLGHVSWSQGEDSPFLEVLRTLLHDPILTTAIALGLVLAVTLGYLAGRRGGSRGHIPPPEDPYYESEYRGPGGY